MARQLVLLLVLAVLGDVGLATAAEPRVPPNWCFALPAGSASAGQQVFVKMECYSCHTVAGKRFGDPTPALADDLNSHNDAYPLARPSQAAAIATLEHEEKIRERIAALRAWAEELAAELRALGVRTYPTQTYFFLADFTRDARALAELL
jgi:hypothetical protein